MDIKNDVSIIEKLSEKIFIVQSYLANLICNKRLEMASVSNVDQASAAESLIPFVHQADRFLFVFGHCQLHDGVGLVHVAVLEVS